jgi:hypothetical protein
MPDARDDVTITTKLRGATEFDHDAHKVARSIDNIGDQARQSARALGVMNAASSGTRVSIGPMSTSMRGGALALGAFVLLAKSATPAILSLAEATATVAVGGGAAGGVGFLALAQGAGVASLAMGDLEKALGGDATALKRLSPEVRGLFDTLNAEKATMKQIADRGLLPGVTKGADSALRNIRVWRSIVKDTSKTLGGVSQDAGGLLGSKSFGRDLGTVGHDNARILGDLGHAAIFAGDGLRHVIVEAEPLTMWLARESRQGAQLADVWALNARNSGRMAHFFREARTDLSLLGSSTEHGTRGIINLFGSQDVNGTKTLRSLDLLTVRFERWSRSPAVRRGVGQAIVDEIPVAVGAILTAIAKNLPGAGATAARTFIDSFMHADAWGKLLAGTFLAKKLGLFGLGKKAVGTLLGGGGRGGGGIAAGLVGRGSTPANPLFVFDVSAGKGPGGGLLKDAKKLLGPAAGAAAEAAPFAVGGALAGGGLIAGLVALGKHQHGPATPEADRAASRAAMRQLGFRPQPQRVDAQGFPDPHGRFVFDINLHAQAPITIDGRELGRAMVVARARDNAAVPNGGLTPAYNAARRAGP